MVGQKGKVSAKTPNYTEVKVSSQFWRAENIGAGDLNVGDEVIVKNVNNLTLLVEKVQYEAPGQSKEEKGVEDQKADSNQ